jgi:hypothetical protein
VIATSTQILLSHKQATRPAPQQFAKTERPQLRHRDKVHGGPTLLVISTPHRSHRHNACTKHPMPCEGFRKPPSAHDYRAPRLRDSLLLHMHTTQQSPTIANLLIRCATHLPEQTRNTERIFGNLATGNRHPPGIATKAHMERLLRTPPNAPEDWARLLCGGSSSGHLLRPHNHDD